MEFEITYVQKRPKRIVTGEHFARSSSFFPVLQLAVGQEAPRGKYGSAGYARIRRVS